ncbi:uracil-DNA glycosylase family protein [Rothia sp. 32237D007AR]
MLATTVSWEIYEELRTLDISDTSIPDVAIAQRKFRLGQAASWARWGDTRHDLSPITAANEDEFQSLAPMTTSVVFLGVNWGGTEAAKEIKDWQNFHTEKHSGDLRLMKSLPAALDEIPHKQGVAAPAPYMTDVFKLVPTRTVKNLNEKIEDDAKDHDHVQRCADLLQAELEICTRGNNGVPPLLIALGNDAFDWLSGEENESGPFVKALSSVYRNTPCRIEKIIHASARRPDAQRTEQLISIFKKHF